MRQSGEKRVLLLFLQNHILLSLMSLPQDITSVKKTRFTNNKKYCNKQHEYMQYFFMISVVWLLFLIPITCNMQKESRHAATLFQRFPSTLIISTNASNAIVSDFCSPYLRTFTPFSATSLSPTTSMYGIFCICASRIL